MATRKKVASSVKTTVIVKRVSAKVLKKKMPNTKNTSSTGPRRTGKI
jgi:hypothetical protein